MRLARELQADFPQPRPLIEGVDRLKCQKKETKNGNLSMFHWYSSQPCPRYRLARPQNTALTALQATTSALCFPRKQAVCCTPDCSRKLINLERTNLPLRRAFGSKSCTIPPQQERCRPTQDDEHQGKQAISPAIIKFLIHYRGKNRKGKSCDATKKL